MTSLIIVDDLSEFFASKNRLIKIGLKFYIKYLQRKLETQILRIKTENLFVAGPREIVNGIKGSFKPVFYEQAFDQIDYARAGKVAANLAENWHTSKEIRSICPYLFDSVVSVPEISYTRLNFLYCYNPVNYYLMLKEIVEKCPDLEEIVTLGRLSEIERTAEALALQKKIHFQVSHSGDLLQWGKSLFSNYIYYRDRKLHLWKSFEHASKTKSIDQYQESDKQAVCLMPSHPLQFRIVIPLAKAINTSEKYEACVVLLDNFISFKEQLNRENIRHTYLWDIDSDGLRKQLRKNHQLLSQSWSQIEGNLKISREFTVEGMNWLQILRYKTQWFFKSNFNEILLLKSRVKKLFQRINPAAIFVFSDSRFFEDSSAAVAKEMKIPVFFYSMAMFFDYDFINRYNTGDYLLVTNDYMCEHIGSQGHVPLDRITTVGDIRFDGQAHWTNPKTQNETRRELGILKGKKVFLLISFYTHMEMTNYDKKRFFELARDAIKEHPDMVLVIKAHPNENKELLQQFVSELKISGAVIAHSAHLYALFGIASGVLTLTSMAALEAMVFDVPVVVAVLPDRNYDYYIPLRKGGITSADSSRSISEVFRKLCDDPDFINEEKKKGRLMVSRYFSKSNADTGERIVAVVESVLSNDSIPAGKKITI